MSLNCVAWAAFKIQSSLEASKQEKNKNHKCGKTGEVIEHLY